MQRRELKMVEPKRQFERVPFDTLSYAKRLQSSGFTQEQAEVQAETFFDIVQDQLISKRDMFELERNLKLDIENIRLEITNVKKDLTKDIKELETKSQTQIEFLRRDLKIWFGGMLVVAVGVLSGMMTLVVHLSG